MTREKNEEQEFLKRVDAMLAGEEVPAGDDGDEVTGDEDLRGMVDFTGKLVDLHDDPTPEFSRRLKSRLLIKLTEQEEMARAQADAAPAERGWFSQLLDSLVPQSQVWRGAAVSLVAVVAVITVLWRTGMFTGTAGVNVPSTDAVAGQITARSMELQTTDEMAADDAVEVEEATAPMAVLSSEPATDELESGMAEAGTDGKSVVVGDIKAELLMSQVSASEISIEVMVSADAALAVDVAVVASYSFDAGPLLTAASPGGRYVTDGGGVNLSWTDLDPSPGDAMMLTFSIDSIGGSEGPWVFEIPLRD